MSTCHLCRIESGDALNRVSSLDICDVCHAADPTAALSAHGIAAEWDVRLGWFNASLGIPGADPDFKLSCVPEQIGHKALKWVVHEVEVGDAAFDSKVYVRTSDAERAARVLANEGVQSALLQFLTGVRVNELRGNHVTIEGATVTIASRPLSAPSEERVQELKLQAAALALHLTAGPA